DQQVLHSIRVVQSRTRTQQGSQVARAARNRLKHGDCRPCLWLRWARALEKVQYSGQFEDTFERDERDQPVYQAIQEDAPAHDKFRSNAWRYLSADLFTALLASAETTRSSQDE